jgi:hypothetical protein
VLFRQELYLASSCSSLDYDADASMRIKEIFFLQKPSMTPYASHYGDFTIVVTADAVD